MTYPVFNNGDALPASDLNAIGLWKITSTTFTGSSSVSINSCFSSNYDSYVIKIATYGSIGSFTRWRLRASGTDASGANYFRYGYYTSYGSASIDPYNGGSETSWVPATQYGSTALGIGTATIILDNPFQSANSTNMQISANDASTGTVYNLNGSHSLAASYDGFTVYPNGGTITGTITVYGVKP